MFPLTPNEATLIGALGGAALGAVIGGAVSFFVARYMVKHGANYSGQIDAINRALASLAATQEEMREQHAAASEAEAQRHADQERKAEVARWKPEARIESKVEGVEQVNKLILKSSQSFYLTEASLIAPNGAKLIDYPMDRGVATTGFGITITHASLNQVAELSPTFFQRDTFSGAIRYSVRREKDSGSYTGDIAFHGERIYLNSTCFYKLSG
jgi:hypothetical protein